MISHAAVLGAGTMGAALAGHFANAGVNVTLFDVTIQAAEAGRARLVKTRPPPLFTPAALHRIATSSFDTLERLRPADWIVEAVLEDLEVKRALMARVSAAARPDAVLSSNTSGIPIAAIGEALVPERRAGWLGTHFFNPPRYLHLVELVATPETDPAVAATLADWLDRRFGKGVVRAKDRPGFIANRIGMFAAIRAIEAMQTLGLSIEAVDALTGPVIGRPKSATFRTLDIAGLDVFLRVADDLAARLGPDGAPFAAPELVRALVDGGALGEKSRRGFYAREGRDGDRVILALDPATRGYRPRAEAALPELAALRARPEPAARIAALFTDRGKAGEFTRATLGRTLLYAADIATEIADSLDDIDRAMRWGFGWELGPFEIWDAVGVPAVLEACGAPTPPALIRDRLPTGLVRTSPLPPVSPEYVVLRAPGRTTIQTNAAGRLVDLGEGVLGLDLHGKLHLVGGDALTIIHAALETAAARFQALVIGSDDDLFSAGADLTLLLLEAHEENWDEIDRMVRQFQRMTRAIQFSPVPVVAAARGLCLGGGCEISLHADRVQAGAELYMGLVEAGVGLIPAGGGSKEILRRSRLRAGLDPFDALQSAFEAAALAKASSSAVEARELGYLRDQDDITMNPDRVLADAVRVARHRAASGYAPPPDAPIAVGGPDTYARLSLGVHLAWRAGRASDHDALIARKLAWVLSGGRVTRPTTLPESTILDLEREAFLSLCGERRTRDRIAHTLKTGKPLRN